MFKPKGSEESAGRKYDYGGRGAVWVQLETASKLQQTTYENAGECIFFFVPGIYLLLNCAVTSDITPKVS
jgi:hypothetical protein